MLVPGDRRADEAGVAAAVGAAKVRLARPEEVVRATGFEPGGVAPFPHLAVAQVLLDTTLLGESASGSGPGRPTTWRRWRPSICSVLPAHGRSTSSPLG